MSAWHRALAGASSVSMVVQITNEFVSLMDPATRDKLSGALIPRGIGNADDIHYCHRRLSRAFPLSSLEDLDADIGEVCAFFLRASARCIELGSSDAQGSNQSSFGPRLQLSSYTSNSLQSRSRYRSRTR